MSVRALLPLATLAALLVGCPSPPDEGGGPAAGGPPPKGPPAEAKAPAPAPDAPAPGDAAAATGDQPGGEPPPPAEGKPGEGPPKAPDADGPPPAEGTGPKPSEGGEPQPAPEPGRAQPENNPGGQAVVITLNQTEPEGPDEGTQSQENVLKKGEYVTLRGEVKCDGCKGDLLLRLRPHFSPDGGPPEDMPAYVTSKVLDAPGEFSILVEKGTHPLVLELLVDANKDGKGTKGERLAVLERAGGVMPDKDLGGLKLDASKNATRPEHSDKLDPTTGPDLKAQDEKRREEGKSAGPKPE